MKTSLTQLSVLFLNGVIITGCATQPMDNSGGIDKPVNVSNVSGGPISASQKSMNIQRNQGISIEENVVYFDYDSSRLNNTANEIISSHISYLKGNPHLSITIEGHADSRGSEAYNKALGTERAFSIKEKMLEENISEEKIRLVSYGENNPAVSGNNDSAWRLNRRAKIVYHNSNEQLSSN